MQSLTRMLIAGTTALAAWSSGQAATARVGQAAPDFTLTDITGAKHSLSEFKGRTVVLEWVNPDCPFVRKHYDKTNNLPKTSAAAMADGVVWLQINSGHPGAQGDYDNAAAAQWQKKHGVNAPYFRDQDGKVGRLYDARTTPHLFIIDGNGTLVYAGGIDSIRSSKPGDIAKATNYVTAALADLKAGRPVQIKNSQPYGCSVKYGQ